MARDCNAKVCYACAKPGHFANRCPSRQGEGNVGMTANRNFFGDHGPARTGSRGNARSGRIRSNSGRADWTDCNYRRSDYRRSARKRAGRV